MVLPSLSQMAVIVNLCRIYRFVNLEGVSTSIAPSLTIVIGLVVFVESTLVLTSHIFNCYLDAYIVF